MRNTPWNKKLPKPHKGAWYVRVRGSYLPCSWQGWLMHILLVATAVSLFFIVREDNHTLAAQIISMTVDLYVIGSIFTFIAKKKS